MPDFSYPQLNSDQGRETGDYLRNVANAAADTVCSLYQQYPSGIVPSLGDPTGIGSFTDGLLNNLCGPRNKVPAPPVSPFNGGQCECVGYRVFFTIVVPNNPTITDSIVKNGPIGSVQKRPAPGGSGSQWGFNHGTPACGGEFFVLAQSASDLTVTITSVERVDGLPDSCGSLPPVYPIVPVPPSVYSPNITIGKPGGSVSVPVFIVPTLIKPTVNFRPEINVKVGAINVNFNLGGIDLSLDNSGGVDITLPSGDSRTPPPTSIPPKDTKYKECDLSGVNALLRDIKECACKKNQVVRTQTYGKSRGRTISLPANTQAVVVTASPTNGVKFQVSEGNAPDVYYVGWASFGVQAPAGERIPLNFGTVGLKAPEGAIAFSYSLSYKSEASLNVYYLEDAP